jgi:hypothetical protein
MFSYLPTYPNFFALETRLYFFGLGENMLHAVYLGSLSGVRSHYLVLKVYLTLTLYFLLPGILFSLPGVISIQ